MTAPVDTEDTKLVYQFDKNTVEDVRATLSTFKGRRLAGLRVYMANTKDDGDHPTKKGITVGVALLPQMLAAVQALCDAAVEEGLLEEVSEWDASEQKSTYRVPEQTV